MASSQRSHALLLAVVLGTLVAAPLHAAPGDTTWVSVLDEEYYNWATVHETPVVMPDGATNWSSIVLRVTIGCPGAPADCDPWDRLGWIQLSHDTGEVDTGGAPIFENFEIARFITPYDITGAGRPGTCDWIFDVSDYEPLLVGDVTVRSYIESWIGDTRGWLLTADLGFVEGDWIREPFQVVNLWTDNRIVYGDPDRPHEDYLPPVDVPFAADAIEAKLRITTTGHGQGNTNNCAEFCQKTHTAIANGTSTSHTLWKPDCEQNVCSPQGGTWSFDRAGWCPGEGVAPWEVDVTGMVTFGSTNTLDYDIQAYENLCRPNNPSCVNGVTCVDCNYNVTGHTEPHWTVQGQLILYREGTLVDVAEAEALEPNRVVLGQNSPNPFNPITWIHYEIREAGTITLVISDAGGRMIRRIERRHTGGGAHRVLWDGRDADGAVVASGVYFYSVEGEAGASTRKMILLK